MPNPLESGPMPAPAQGAEPVPGNALQQSGPPMAGAPGNAAPPPPTHAQTVAALRHFDAIKGELSTILKNPALGRSDVKSQIIDGVAKLVSERMISPGQAVIQLSQVPSDPLQQRKWIQTQMMQAVQAEHSIVETHRNTNLGSGDWATEAQQHNTNPDTHMQDIAALTAGYGGGK